ncbi:MAG: diguanylate cyclase [Dehalococcoidia bacterium]
MEERRAVTARDGRGFNKVYSSYFRAAWWSRAASVAFWVMVALFFLWATPVFPWGMSRNEYSPEVLFAFFILGCCPAIVAVAMWARSEAAQRRQALVAWASIYDRATGLRNREYFLERLQLQCRLGQELAEYRVGLILVTVETTGGNGDTPQPAEERLFRLVGMHIASQMRPSDLVAVVSGTELAVLVSAGSPVALQTIAGRIRRLLSPKMKEMAGQAASRLLIRMGAASLEDAEPEALLAAARNDFKDIYKGESEASAA